jgi:hypothetical protein
VEPSPGIALHSLTWLTSLYFLALLLCLAVAAAYAREAVTRALARRRWLRGFDEVPPLPRDRRGPAEVVGVVRADRTGDEIVRVTLRQRAETVTVGKTTATDWKEQARAVEAQPFTIVDERDGARIPVVAGDRPILRAAADVVPGRAGEREIIAVLHDGERARVRGVLVPAGGSEAGYRDATAGEHVLTAPEGGRLEIEVEDAVEQQDLAARAARRGLSMFLVPLWLVLSLAVVWHAEALRDSVTVTARVVSTRTCSYTAKGRTTSYPCFDASTGDDRLHFGGISGTAAWGDLLTVAYVRSDPGTFTKGDTLDPGGGVTAILLSVGLVVLLLALGRFIHAGDQRRWFDAEPFDSREPGG